LFDAISIIHVVAFWSDESAFAIDLYPDQSCLHKDIPVKEIEGYSWPASLVDTCLGIAPPNTLGRAMVEMTEKKSIFGMYQ